MADEKLTALPMINGKNPVEDVMEKLDAYVEAAMLNHAFPSDLAYAISRNESRVDLRDALLIVIGHCNG